VLVSTATLAWGVNLPAHTVIICGTQLYDASQGRFVELGMLDVQQIFGRAGRPQYDTSGEGIIITELEQMTHYLRLMTHQLPIESRFVEHLEDHLNAEVVLGTVTDVDEAVRWLSYTYLHTRMLANPLRYGVTSNELELDRDLFAKRRALIEAAAARLDECRMVRFDRRTGALAPTDLGRSASFFYLRHETIDAFNEGLGQRGAPGNLALDVGEGANNTTNMTPEQLAANREQRRRELAARVLADGSPAPPSLNDSAILALVCGAGEFEHVKLRDDEVLELDQLYAAVCRVRVRGDRHSPGGKVATLLQAHVSRAKIESFSLTSDAMYVEQNAARIVRGLFEIVLKRRWARLASRLLDWCLMLEHRQWDTQHPLRQVGELSPDAADAARAAPADARRARRAERGRDRRDLQPAAGGRRREARAAPAAVPGDRGRGAADHAHRAARDAAPRPAVHVDRQGVRRVAELARVGVRRRVGADHARRAVSS
jgi:activating signal cointegrator complex subunit 3